jgi:hypothetical protein
MVGMIDAREYQSMEFNPMCKKDMMVEYPKLKEIMKGEGTDREVRYLILMYDANSPLKKHYPDLVKRKQFAASLAGYDMMIEKMDTLFDFKGDMGIPDDRLLNLVISYLKYQNNWVWTMIVSNEQAFYEYNKRVMMPVDGERDKDILQAITIKTQIMTAQDEIYQRLRRYYKDLTGGDENLDELIMTNKRLRPEDIAKNVQPNR